MAVVLTILKILGIILLCILGLLILLLLMVLFIPIRYRVNGEYTSENINAAAKVRWFIFRVLVNYNKGDPMAIRAKVLCFTVYSMGVKRKDENAPHAEVEPSLPPPETAPEEAKPDSKPEAETKPETVTKPEMVTEPETATKPEPVTKPETVTEPAKTEVPAGSSGESKTEDKPESQLPVSLPEDTGGEEEESQSPIGKITSKIESVKTKVETKKRHLDQFLEREATQRTITRGKKLLKKIFKHLKPRKGRVDLHLGLGSAADTGMTLGKIARFYPLYGKWLFITPDFYEKVIEASGDVKGRIRIGTIAIPALIFYLRRDTRRTIKLAKKI